MDKFLLGDVGFFVLTLSPVLLAIVLYAYMAREKAIWRKAIGIDKAKARKIPPRPADRSR